MPSNGLDVQGVINGMRNKTPIDGIQMRGSPHHQVAQNQSEALKTL